MKTIALSFFLFFAVWKNFCWVGLLVLFAGNAYAMPFMAELMQPPGLERKTDVGLSFQAHPKQNISTLTTDWYQDQIDAEVTVPLAQSQDSVWLLSAKHEYWSVETGPQFALPDGVIFEQREFHDVGVQLGYQKQRGNKDSWGLLVGISSPSDKPFHSWDETNLSFTSYYLYNQSRTSTWALLLNFATNRGELSYIPLPGVVYLYRPSRRFQAALGFPMIFLRYAPMKQLELMAYTVLVYQSELRATWRPIMYIHPFVSFSLNQKSFLRTNREDRDLRFYSLDKEIAGGFRLPWSRTGGITFKAGHAYDRRLFESDRAREKERGLVEVDGGWFYKLGFRFQF